MKGFEIINSTTRAYKFVWNNRHICAQYGIFPLAAQILCYAALVMMGMEGNILRQGLFMLPAYFVEGAVICLLVKFALDSLPKQGTLFAATSITTQPSEYQKKLLTAGTIVFVLVQMAFVVGISFWIKFMIAKGLMAAEPVQPSTETALTSMVIFMVVIWSVRLAWLYVPVVMGLSLKRYLRLVAPFASSFYMIAIALLCSIPTMFFVWIIIQILMAILGLVPETMGVVAQIFLSIFQIFAGLLTTLLTSIAMAYALYPFLSGNKIDQEV